MENKPAPAPSPEPAPEPEDESGELPLVDEQDSGVRPGIREKLRRLPDSPGVYLMRDRLGGVLYVGKAKSLRKRVASYFQRSRQHSLQQPKVAAMIPLIHDLETIEVRSEAEALLLEGRLIKEWRPKYNTDFTDDKRFLLVRLDSTSALPRFRLARVKTDERSRYFGPFAHSGLLRRALSEMRRRFGILLGDVTPKRLEDGRWQLYDDVRAELYGHANILTEAEYAGRVEEACDFLEGKSAEWLAEMREEMARAAASRAYEKAAYFRDMIAALEKTIAPVRRFSGSRTPGKDLPEQATSASSALESLRRELALPELPQTIECFDISHIAGSFTVASMVRFAGGKPDRKNYRRYKIKSFTGNDDFRAMAEVVGRRYKRLQEEDRAFPQIVLIDGGAGQVAAALRAFLSLDLVPPTLMGLAKKKETLIFCDGRPPLNLPLHHPGLRLLQQVRDEAHRFANTFNADLRSEKIRQTILDDFPGLGPVRQKALWQHFKNLQTLRTASVSELAAVDGIGPATATKLHAFLQQHAATGIRIIQPR